MAPASPSLSLFSLGDGDLLRLLLLRLLHAAREGSLALAWGKVCFSAWDSCLGGVAGLVAWEQWPPALRALLHALYPAWFVYSNVRKLNGPGGPARPRDFSLLLSVACACAAARGLRDGRREKLS